MFALRLRLLQWHGDVAPRGHRLGCLTQQQAASAKPDLLEYSASASGNLPVLKEQTISVRSFDLKTARNERAE